MPAVSTLARYNRPKSTQQSSLSLPNGLCRPKTYRSAQHLQKSFRRGNTSAVLIAVDLFSPFLFWFNTKDYSEDKVGWRRKYTSWACLLDM